MTDSLKQSTERIFKDIELDNDKLNALMDLEKGQASDKASTGWSIKPRKLAAALFVVVSVSMFAINQYKHYQKDNIVELIVAEVVKNHSHLKPLEVNAQSFETVASYFDGLNFLPYVSQKMGVTQLIRQGLLGGRYCSIQGGTAAQLRMQLSNGAVATLFQTSTSELFSSIPGLNGSNSVVVYQSGYQVSMWQEKGLLMVLVAPAASQ